jgi:hypothetical protein
LPWGGEKQWQHQNKFNTSGVCQVTCPMCTKMYTRQTGRNFNTIILEQQQGF